MATKLQKVQMRVSIASADWSYQVGQVVLIDADLAKKWRDVGHCLFVNGALPLTDFNSLDGLADLDAEQALRHRCVHCELRARFVLQSQPYCAAHYRSAMGR